MKNKTIIGKIAVLFMMLSVLSFSKDFWEKSRFVVNVTENMKMNKSTKTKKYVMTYSSGTLKIQMTDPTVHKGESYTFTGSTKTIYYPSLNQTVTQKLQEDESNILSVFNKLNKLTEKKTQTKNGDTFTFDNSWLVSITSKGYKVNFSDYVKAGEYTYPSKISVTDGNSQIIYRLSNFR